MRRIKTTFHTFNHHLTKRLLEVVYHSCAAWLSEKKRGVHMFDILRNPGNDKVVTRPHERESNPTGCSLASF